MENLLQQMSAIRAEIEAAVANTPEEAEQFRTKYLGSKGLVKHFMGEMKQVPVDQKKEFGQIMNSFKQFAEEKLLALQAAVAAQKEHLEDTLDTSLPGDPIAAGSRHPVTLMRNRIVSIFQRLGFDVAEGPEIEDDWHNFTALNIAENHPARDMQDTFYLAQNPDWLLRTHTSNVQIRAMETSPLPIRIICPGRVYRNETISSRKGQAFDWMQRSRFSSSYWPKTTFLGWGVAKAIAIAL